MSSGESAEWHDEEPPSHDDDDDDGDDSDYVDDEPRTSSNKGGRRRKRLASSEEDEDEAKGTKARKKSSTPSTARKKRKIVDEDEDEDEEDEEETGVGVSEPLQKGVGPKRGRSTPSQAAGRERDAANGPATSLKDADATTDSPLLSPTSTPLAKPTHRRKTSKSRIPRSAMPLLLPKKSSKVLLVEVDDPKLDLSGDTGAVGRLKVNDNVITVDLKGNLYKGSLVDCNSMLMVQIGNESARIESIIDSFLPATPCGNIFDSERVVHGTCDVEGIDIDADVNVNNDNDDVDKSKKRRGKK